MNNNQKPSSPNFNPVSNPGRLVTDRYEFEDHLNGINPPYATNFRHDANQVDMSPLITIAGQQPPNVQAAIALLAGALFPISVNPATNTSLGIIQLAGDLGGNNSATSPRVSGLQGFPVSALTPTINYVLTWNGSAWAPAPATGGGGGGTLAGDATGPLLSNTVVKINGATVPASGSLTTGNVLQVNGAASLTYAPVNLAGGVNYVTGTLPAGNLPNLAGDVTGAINANTVVKLQGNAVAATAPTTNQVLTWNGSAWAPATPSGGGSGVIWSADLQGSTNTSQTIAKLQGFTLAASGGNAPTANQVLQYSGTAWVPVTLASSYPPNGAAGGDLTGTYPNPTIAKLQGISVTASGGNAPTTNQVLQYNGTVWKPATLTGAFTPGGDLTGNSSTQYVQSLGGANNTGGAIQLNSAAWIAAFANEPIIKASGSQYILATDVSANTELNTVGTAINFQVGTGTYAFLTSSQFELNVAQLLFASNMTSGTIAWDGGTAAPTGGSLILQPQTSSTATSGSVVCNLNAPVGSGNEPYLQVNRSGVPMAYLGALSGGGGASGALYLGPNSFTDFNSFTLAADGPSHKHTTLNGGTSIFFKLVNSTNLASMTSGGINMFPTIAGGQALTVVPWTGTLNSQNQSVFYLPISIRTTNLVPTTFYSFTLAQHQGIHADIIMTGRCVSPAGVDWPNTDMIRGGRYYANVYYTGSGNAVIQNSGSYNQTAQQGTTDNPNCIEILVTTSGSTVNLQVRTLEPSGSGNPTVDYNIILTLIYN